ncbi:hypothetical protein ZPAH1_orf00119 [Aeromonas phage ZPAH1]|nr:hypothetical protein ZPAH1_orf00119 [Aeromonas phage ZPAH1]
MSRDDYLKSGAIGSLIGLALIALFLILVSSGATFTVLGTAFFGFWPSFIMYSVLFFAITGFLDFIIGMVILCFKKKPTEVG